MAYLLYVMIFAIVATTVLSGQDQIVFPGKTRSSNRKTTVTSTTPAQSRSTRIKHSTTVETTTTPTPFQDDAIDKSQIPLDEIRRLNEIDSVEEFFKLYEKENENVSLTGLRILPEERRNVETPKPAKCEPEMTTVSLQNSTNNFMIFFPSCTRVMRCGGCCNSDLLSCQPTAVQSRFFQVYVSEYVNGQLVPFKRKETVEVEEHTKCMCDCRIKPEHCNIFQEYMEKDCRCRCVNYEDRQKCESENSTKIWDFNTCMCACREVSECSTGFYFNEHACSCKPEPVFITRFGEDNNQQKRRPQGNRNGYITQTGLSESNTHYRVRD